jgi:2'-5' RNA ligase
MRLFVSVRPSAEAVAHLTAALSGRVTSRPDQWHITLAYLGEVEDPDELNDGLRAAAAGTPSFDVRLAGGGAFTRARVVWVGVGGDVEVLGGLAAQVQRVGREAGLPLEARRFRPHLTVGRTGRIDPGALHDYTGPPWQVRDIELVHSVLGRTATHSVLERFALYQA